MSRMSDYCLAIEETLEQMPVAATDAAVPYGYDDFVRLFAEINPDLPVPDALQVSTVWSSMVSKLDDQ